ncbi:uncharacterized protein TRAVEDRAFT_26027 [Trametes versicolor FP-101664 SS1]|uniref:uncharacterized protein n=1 Tax=Trametes versicolor (strain FP-101664) TaxID=717944 RepID=UPI000462483E|nr:uncharacterized protein TRAVEDRAFT_26027 [Trametes versicolor FP-101664 SS1]EIW65068.1 hypothetical protein TRAVEDRAFT_26027 [Trametes versicolor FP-101664 SS1]
MTTLPFAPSREHTRIVYRLFGACPVDASQQQREIRDRRAPPRTSPECSLLHSRSGTVLSPRPRVRRRPRTAPTHEQQPTPRCQPLPPSSSSRWAWDLRAADAPDAA